MVSLLEVAWSTLVKPLRLEWFAGCSLINRGLALVEPLEM